MYQENDISKKIRAMRPGGASDLKAVKKSNGEVVTDPQEIAEELERYWK